MSVVSRGYARVPDRVTTCSCRPGLRPGSGPRDDVLEPACEHRAGQPGHVLLARADLVEQPRQRARATRRFEAPRVRRHLAPPGSGGAQAAHAAGMRVAAIRGLGYDGASGYADVVVDRLDPDSLELMLALGEGQEGG